MFRTLGCTFLVVTWLTLSSHAQVTRLGDPFGSAPQVGNLLAIAIATGPDDLPCVAWQQSDRNLFVERFDGTRWLSLGDGINPYTETRFRFNASIHDLEVDSLGRPIVVWSAGNRPSATTKLWVTRYDNGVWTPLGDGPLNVREDRNIHRAFLEIDQFDTPFVAWHEFGLGEDSAAYARCFLANRWRSVGVQGGRIPSGVRGFEVAMRRNGVEALNLVATDDPFSSIRTTKIELSRFTNLYKFGDVHWRTLPSPIERMDPSSRVLARNVKLTTARTGHPMLLWTEDEAQNEVAYVARYRFLDKTWQHYDTSGLPRGNAVRFADLLSGLRQPIVSVRQRSNGTGLRLFEFGDAIPEFVMGDWIAPNQSTVPGSARHLALAGQTIYLVTLRGNPQQISVYAY